MEYNSVTSRGSTPGAYRGPTASVRDTGNTPVGVTVVVINQSYSDPYRAPTSALHSYVLQGSLSVYECTSRNPIGGYRLSHTPIAL